MGNLRQSFTNEEWDKLESKIQDSSFMVKNTKSNNVNKAKLTMKVTIEVTDRELKDLELIRDYFIEHDVTLFEHFSYAVLANLVNKIKQYQLCGLEQ